MNNRGLIISCHISIHLDHQQGCSRRLSASYIKDVLLSHAIKTVGCHLSHRITLPRKAYSSWSVSQILPDKSGKARNRNHRFIPALNQVFFHMQFFHTQFYTGTIISVFTANMSLIHFSLFFSFFPNPIFQSPGLILLIPVSLLILGLII